MTETEQKPKGRVPRYFRVMNTARTVRRGMVKVMNDMQAGRISHQIGGKLLYGLNCVQNSLDSELIEQRLAALESQAESRVIQGNSPPPASRQPLRLVHDAETEQPA
jgi:hypothetical protein